MAILADSLIAGVKRRITMPASQSLDTNNDILAFADSIISSRIVPMVEAVNQEFFVYKTDIDLVAGQSIYSIPYRAIGRTLRELKLRTSDSNVRNVSLIALEDAQIFQSSVNTIGFYFLSDKIKLVPDVPSNISPDQTLEMWYRMAPSRLVQSSDAMLVTGISGGDITVADVPSFYVPGVDIDFIQGKSGNTIYATDKAVLNVSGNIVTFDPDDVPSDLTTGDYLSLAETSPVINFIPNEVYSLIESYVSQRLLNSLGDFDGAARIRDDDLSIEERNIKSLLEPRIDGEPTIIINRYSLTRGNKFSQRSWLYGQ